MSDSKREVQEVLEQIKDVFSKYTVTHPVEGSPVSVSEEMQHDLEHDTYNTLPRYFFSAMTTWGTEEDFKAFLPMILEIYTFNNSHLYSGDMLFRKMKYAKFDEWDNREQHLIHDYCQALWNHLLDSFKEGHTWHVREFIKDVFQPEKYLIIWESRLHEVPALRHLVVFINDAYRIHYRGLNAVGVGEIHDNWIVSETMLNRLEAAYFQYIDEEFSKELSIAVENIKWLLSYNKPAEK